MAETPVFAGISAAFTVALTGFLRIFPAGVPFRQGAGFFALAYRT